METNKISLDNIINSSQPCYLYKDPMFMVTVSVVIIVETGIVVIPFNTETYKFPGGKIRAGQETIPFAAVRYIKEQTGIRLKKEDLIPVDFRSDPERSNGRNIIDIGMVCIPDLPHDFLLNDCAKLITVDFDTKNLVEEHSFYMDDKILLERAIDIILLMK